MQRNWHFNLLDQMGTLSETNTFFPWNLDKAMIQIQRNVEKTKEARRMKQNIDWIHNEFVVHDNVPMKYCTQVIDTESIGYKLPKTEQFSNETPDMSLLPF